MLMPALIAVLLAAALSLACAACSIRFIGRLEPGTPRMQAIAAAIRLGARTFLIYEYRMILRIVLIAAALLTLLISWQMAASFLLGAALSAAAGWVGMQVATAANVRVSNCARTTQSLGKTLQLAYRGGSVMGLCVGGFALLGIALVYLIFGCGMGQIEQALAGRVVTNRLGLPVTFPITLSGYALGCSLIAMFNRVGGGIYTKAADMGADLVGKTELNIPEDDPRNPATIADNVGDNVGDVAGLGADLLESYVGAILSAAILAVELFRNRHTAVSEQLLTRMMLYPVLFAAVGLLCCVIGIGTLLIRKNLSDRPGRELSRSTQISALLTLAGGLGLTAWLFGTPDGTALGAAGFRIGRLSPWAAAGIGIAAGMLIGFLAEHYTSSDRAPTRGIADATREGPALTITAGLAVGMSSTLLPVSVLAGAIFAAYAVCGMYGVAMAAVGMLSFVSATVSVDAYGPISDNAGGISEMSGLSETVRAITDRLDAAGNTTAAIGKGFAIGSAALAALSMMVSYLYSYTPADQTIVLNLVSPLTLAGLLAGGALPWAFSGMLIRSVTRAARSMVAEVRRQFREIRGLLTGEAEPDYKTCIEISSRSALQEMRRPALISVLFPLLCGFLFGAEFVGGVLMGATLSAILLALFTGTAGGAWDNAKKHIEGGGVDGEGRGSPAHCASVVGDTVGDPLKDTVGPSLDILIKIMSVVSLIGAVIFSRWNLIHWLFGL